MTKSLYPFFVAACSWCSWSPTFRRFRFGSRPTSVSGNPTTQIFPPPDAPESSGASVTEFSQTEGTWAAVYGRGLSLETPTARTLYHEYAAPQPISITIGAFPPADIAGNSCPQHHRDLPGGDHGKWRFMRSAGVTEDFDRQPAGSGKFRRFAKRCWRSATRSITALSELRRFFRHRYLGQRRNRRDALGTRATPNSSSLKSFAGVV